MDAARLLEELEREFGELPDGVLDRAGRLAGQRMRSRGRDSLLTYCTSMPERFDTPGHIRRIAEALEQVERGEIRRLALSVPPRHGKSALVSRLFPTWALGRRPDRKILLTSYSAELATDFTRWQRDTMALPEYGDVFPGMLVRADSRAANRFQTHGGGMVVGAGIGGPLTGRGMDLGIIDDPIKNSDEARSPTIKQRHWDWYHTTFRTRLHPGGAIVVVMTRWATDDLIGRLLETEGDRWTVIQLPAIDEAGNALWPSRYSLADLEEIRDTMPRAHWASLYQQQPIDLVERIMGDPVYGTAPSGLKLFAYLDPAFKGTDRSALTIGGLEARPTAPDGQSQESLCWITDGRLWSEPIDEVYDRVERALRDSNVQRLYVESNQAQYLIANEFRRRGFAVEEVNHTRNKYLRIVDGPRKYWKRLRFSGALSGTEYMREVTTYSELAEHDDAPDSLAGLVDAIMQLPGAQVHYPRQVDRPKRPQDIRQGRINRLQRNLWGR